MTNTEYNPYKLIIEEGTKKGLDPLPLIISGNTPDEILETLKHIKPKVGFFGGLAKGIGAGATDIVERLARVIAIPVGGTERPAELAKAKEQFGISEESPLSGKIGYILGTLAPYIPLSAIPWGTYLVPALIGVSEAQRIYEEQPEGQKSIGRAVAAGAAEGALTALPIHRISKLLHTPTSTVASTVLKEAGIGAVSFPVISTLMNISSQLGTEGKINADVLDAYVRTQSVPEAIAGGILGGLGGLMAGRMAKPSEPTYTPPPDPLDGVKTNLKTLLKQQFPEASERIDALEIDNEFASKMLSKGVSPKELNEFIMGIGEELGLVTAKERFRPSGETVSEQWSKFLKEKERNVEAVLTELKKQNLIGDEEFKQFMEIADTFGERRVGESPSEYRARIKGEILDMLRGEATEVDHNVAIPSAKPPRSVDAEIAKQWEGALDEKRTVIKGITDDLVERNLITKEEQAELINMADTIRDRGANESIKDYTEYVRGAINDTISEWFAQHDKAIRAKTIPPAESISPRDLELQRQWKERIEEKRSVIENITNDLLRRNLISEKEKAEFLEIADAFRDRRADESLKDYTEAIRKEIDNIINESIVYLDKNVRTQRVVEQDKTSKLPALVEMVNQREAERDSIVKSIADEAGVKDVDVSLFNIRRFGEDLDTYKAKIKEEFDILYRSEPDIKEAPAPKPSEESFEPEIEKSPESTVVKPTIEPATIETEQPPAQEKSPPETTAQEKVTAKRSARAKRTKKSSQTVETETPIRPSLDIVDFIKEKPALIKKEISAYEALNYETPLGLNVERVLSETWKETEPSHNFIEVDKFRNVAPNTYFDVINKMGYALKAFDEMASAGLDKFRTSAPEVFARIKEGIDKFSNFQSIITRLDPSATIQKIDPNITQIDVRDITIIIRKGRGISIVDNAGDLTRVKLGEVVVSDKAVNRLSEYLNINKDDLNDLIRASSAYLDLERKYSNIIEFAKNVDITNPVKWNALLAKEPVTRLRKILGVMGNKEIANSLRSTLDNIDYLINQHHDIINPDTRTPNFQVVDVIDKLASDADKYRKNINTESASIHIDNILNSIDVNNYVSVIDRLLPQSDTLKSKLGLSIQKKENKFYYKWGDDNLVVFDLDRGITATSAKSPKAEVRVDILQDFIDNILGIDYGAPEFAEGINKLVDTINKHPSLKAKVRLRVAEGTITPEPTYNRDEFVAFVNDAVKRILKTDRVNIVIAGTNDKFITELRKMGVSDDAVAKAFAGHGVERGEILGATVQLPNLMTTIFINEFPHSNNIRELRRTAIHEIAEVLLLNGRIKDKDIEILRREFSGKGRYWGEEFADALADYILNKDLAPKGLSGRVKAVMDTIADFIERLRNFLEGYGFKSAKSIIKSIAEGRYVDEAPEARYIDPVGVALRIKKETGSDKTAEQIVDSYFRYLSDTSGGVKPLGWLAKWLTIPQWSNNFFVRKIFQIINDAGVTANELIQGSAYEMITSLQNMKKSNKEMFNNLSKAILVSGELETILPDSVLREKFNLDDTAIKVYKKIPETTYSYLKKYLETTINQMITLMHDGAVRLKDGATIEQIIRAATEDPTADGKIRDLGKLIEPIVEVSAEQLKDAAASLYRLADSAREMLYAVKNSFYYPRIRPQGNYAVSLIEKNLEKPTEYLETWRVHTSGRPLIEKRELREIVANLSRDAKNTLTVANKMDLDKIDASHDYIIIYDRTLLNDILPRMTQDQKVILIEKMLQKNEPMINRLALMNTREGINTIVERILKRGDIPEEKISELLDDLSNELNLILYGKSFSRSRMLRRLGFYKPDVKQITSVPELETAMNNLKVVKGYEEDVLKALTEYVVKEAQAVSRIKAATDVYIFSALNNLGDYIAKDATFGEWYDRYLKATLSPMSDAMRALQPVKTMATMWYLGFKVSSGLMQLVQALTVGVPELAKFIRANSGALVMYERTTGTKDYLLSQPKAIKMFSKSVADVISPSRLSKEELEVLNSPEAKSKTETMFYSEILAETDPGDKFISPLINASMLVFRYFEQISRTSGFLTAYRLAKEKGLSKEEAMKFASKFTDQAFFVFSRANKPLIAIGDSGFTSAMNLTATLRGYTLNYIGWVYDALTEKLGKREADKVMASFAYTMLLGGMAAAPFISDIIDAISKMIGVPIRQKLVYSATKDKGLRQALEFGVLAPFGIDISASLGLDILPSELSLSGLADYVFGVYRGIEKKATITKEMLKAGEYSKALESAMPVGIERMIASVRASLGEPMRTTYGRQMTDEYGRPLKLSETELALQALGFRPTTLTYSADMYQASKLVETNMAKKRDSIYLAYKMADTPEELREVNRRIAEYNREARKYMGAIPLITPESLRRVKKEAAKPSFSKEILTALGY